MHGRFYGLGLKREIVVLEILHRYARLVNDEENGLQIRRSKEEIWIYTLPAWLIAVRERMLEFYSD